MEIYCLTQRGAELCGLEQLSAANNNHTAYFAVSNMVFNFFSTNSSKKYAIGIPVFDVIKNGIGKGKVTAIEI